MVVSTKPSGLEVPPRGLAGFNRILAPVASRVSSICHQGVHCFAMDPPKIFETKFHPSGIQTTFHGELTCPSHFPDLIVPPLGFAFKVLNGTGNSTVEGGVISVSPARANFLGMQPGMQFTALRVQPTILEGFHGRFCWITLHDDQTDQGSLVKHPHGMENAIIMDVCSGMGGWHFGGQPYGFQPSISIECDPEVATMGSYNLRSTQVTSKRVASSTYGEFLQWLSSGITIQTEFQDETFWEKAACKGVGVIVASLPCPPWSSLAKGNGLMDPRGSLFADFRFLVHVFRPAIVAMENVKGLILHQDWDCIKRWFHEIGYVCSHVSVDSLHHVLPMHRDRASIVFANRSQHADLTSLIIKPTPMPQLPVPPNPMKRQIFHQEVPDILIDTVTISPEHHDILTDVEVWPKTWKIKHPQSDPKKVDIRERNVSKTKPIPCAVAKYGQPDKIERELLCNKGLYMCTIEDSQFPARWISPCEIMMALGFPKHTMISRNPILAYHILGNSVSPLHAMLTIARVATIYPRCVKAQPDILQAIMTALTQVPRMNESVLHWDEQVMWYEDPITLSQPIPLAICDAKLGREDEQDDQTNRPNTHESQKLKKLKTQHTVVQEAPNNVEPVQPIPVTQIDLTADLQDSSQEEGCASEMPMHSTDNLCEHAGFCLTRPVFSHQHASIPFFQIDYPKMRPFEKPSSDGNMDTFQWITGFASRFDRESYTNSNQALCTRKIRIFDIQQSWKCDLYCDTIPTIETAMQWVNPFCDHFHFQAFHLDGLSKNWNDICDGIQLQVTPFKMRINLAISGSHEFHQIYCDPFDTVQTICNECPSFQHFGDPHWLALEHTNYFNIDHPLTFRRLGPLDSVARFHRPTWTLVRGMEQPKGDKDCKDDSMKNNGDLPDPDPTCEGKITIAIFHPFTNKFAVQKFPASMCVAEILDCLEPPVPSTVPIIVEHNAKRMDLTTRLDQLPAKATLRFRHFSGVGGMDPQACLRTELLARGVPPKQVNNRVSAVVSAIGESPLRDAFLHHDPWARVKETCTTHNVRLLMPNELKDHQKQRRTMKSDDSNPNEASSSSSKGKGKGKSKGKSRKGKTDLPPIPPWNELTLPSEGFTDHADEHLPFIQPAQLVRDAQGICPMNHQDAQAFVASNAASTLSSDPLAILVPGHIPKTTEPVIEHLTLPVVHQNEPILIPASIIQLGAEFVKYAFQGPTITIDTTESTVLEVHLESTRCPQWSSKIKPLDILPQLIPGVKKTHQLIGQWSWKWMDDTRKICSPDVATKLHGYMRVATEAVNQFLALSGPHGLSLWPKAPNRAPCPLYSHIPVEASDEKQAQAIAQTAGFALGFVHTQSDKWMIRCKREDFPTARRLLLPHGVTIGAAAVEPDDTLYVLHPADECPLSTTPNAIEKGLHQMGWNAKVIKPMGSTSWLIASDSGPDHSHISINDHVCSIQSIEAFRARQPKSSYRSPPGLTMNNPWAFYKPTQDVPSLGAKNAQGPTASRFDEMEKKLQQHFEKAVVQAVENKMQPVVSRIEQIEQSVATTSNLHEQRLTAVESEVQSNTNTMQTLQTQINANHQQSMQQMKDLFDSLIQRDTDDKNKRPRTDAHE